MNLTAHLVSSYTSLAFLKNLSEKRKSTSPAVIQVKIRWKTMGIEEKLDVISLLEKGEWIVDLCHNVTFAHMSLPSFHHNADRIPESAKSGTKVFV